MLYNCGSCNGVCVNLNIWEESIDNDNNKTKFGYQLLMYSTSGSYVYTTGTNINITIQGTTYVNINYTQNSNINVGTYNSSASNPKWIASGYTNWIDHNNDGTLNVSLYVNMNCQWDSQYRWSLNTTMQATTIARAATFTVDKTSAYVGDNVTFNITSPNTDFSTVLQFNLHDYNYTYSIASGTSTWTVPSVLQQYMQGISETVLLYIHTYNASGTYLGSNSIQFTIRQIASTLTISNSEISYNPSGNSITINTTSVNTNYMQKLYISFYDFTQDIYINYSQASYQTDYTINPDIFIPKLVTSYIEGQTTYSASGKFILETYYNGTLIETQEKSFNYSVESSYLVPSIGSVSRAISHKFSAFNSSTRVVQNDTYFKITWNNVYTKFDATLSKIIYYWEDTSGNKYGYEEGSVSNTSGTWTTSVINFGGGSFYFKCAFVDNKGFTAYYDTTSSQQIYSYHYPKIVLTYLYRTKDSTSISPQEDGTGLCLQLTVTATYFPTSASTTTGTSLNVPVVTKTLYDGQGKKQSEPTKTYSPSMSYDSSTDLCTLTYKYVYSGSTDYSYYAKVSIKDLFNISSDGVSSNTVPTAYALMDIITASDGTPDGIAIGKVASLHKVVDLDYSLQYKCGSISQTDDLNNYIVSGEWFVYCSADDSGNYTANIPEKNFYSSGWLKVYGKSDNIDTGYVAQELHTLDGRKFSRYQYMSNWSNWLETQSKSPNIVIIGDSYTEGYSPDGTGTVTNGDTTFSNVHITSWVEYFKNSMGLDSSNCIANYCGGKGFSTEKTFTDLLTDLSNATESKPWSIADSDYNLGSVVSSTGIYIKNKYSVTDVICVGGYNDANLLRLNSGNLSEAMGKVNNGIKTFIETAKSYFPNAKIHIGFFGWTNDTNGSYGGINQVYAMAQAFDCYKNATELYGGYFLDGIENIMHNREYFASDTVHPNSNGQQQLALGVKEAFQTGHANVYYTTTFPTLTALNGYVIDSGSMYTLLKNDVVQIAFSDLWIYPPDTSGTTWDMSNTSISFASFSNGFILGNSLWTHVPVNALYQDVDNSWKEVTLKLSIELGVVKLTGSTWTSITYKELFISGCQFTVPTMEW